MIISNDEFKKVIAFSNYLEYFLYLLENGIAIEVVTQKEVDALRYLVEHDIRKYILKNVKQSYFKSHIKLDNKLKAEYLLIKETSFFFIMLISKANALFKKLGTCIQITNQRKVFILCGAENEIRILKYIFSITLVENMSPKSIVTNSSLIGKGKTELIDSIIHDSLRERYFIPDLTEDFLTLADCFYMEVDLAFSQKFSHYFTSEDHQVIGKERFFYYFSIFQFYPEKLTEEMRMKIGDRLLDIDNEIILQSKALFSFLQNKYDISTSQYTLSFFEFILHLLLATGMYQSEKYYYSNKLKLDSSEIDQFQHMIYTHFEHMLSLETLHFFSAQMADLLFSYLPCIHIKPIKVAIHFLYRCNNGQIVKNYISGIYNKDNLRIVSDFCDADVIIADNEIYRKVTQALFYFGDIDDLNTWRHLDAFIHKKIIDHRLFNMA